MIPVAELDTLARARIDDAKALHAASRADGAIYLCGYSVEIALKARICRTLNWNDFPAVRKEFDGFASFKTHDLDVLLRLSGQEARIKQGHFQDWNAVAIWNPEARYRQIGSVTLTDAEAMIKAADALMKVL